MLKLKNYNPGSRRVFASGGYLLPVILVAVISVALVLLLLAYMPLTDVDSVRDAQENEIIGISYPDETVGMGASVGNILVNVTYKDGTVKEVPLSDMVSEGLNVTKPGQQLVALSYGGFEQTIPMTVVDVSCEVVYVASVGGNVVGETVQSVRSGEDATKVVAVPETGYVFSEWSDGYPYAERKDTCINGNRRYMANFEKEKFRVIFYYNDGTVAREVDVLYGQAVTDVPKMSDPKMNVYGYTFEGWSVAESDYLNVYRNLNIYPQYTKTATDIDLTVSADQYGNNMGITDVNECGYYANDEFASITATPYNSREFNCWYVYGYYYDEVLTEWVEGWAKLPKQSASGEATLDVYIGDRKILCTFTANAESNSGTNYKLTFMPKEGMELLQIKAEFVYSKSAITFVNYQNAKKGNQECTIADVPFGMTVREALAGKATTESLNLDDYGMLLPADLATTYGMEFLGWYVKTDENQTLITTEKTFKEPTTLIAQWKKLTYEVIFDYTTSETPTYTYSTQVVFQNTIGTGTNGGVPVMTPYLDKYVFVGWEDTLTHELIDDTTQVIAKEKYIDQKNDDSTNNFRDYRKIYISPRWKEKEHTLQVGMKGSGTVLVEVTPDVGETRTEQISGNYTLLETYAYKIIFFAGEGNAVSRYEWKHGDVNEVHVETQQTDKITASIFEDMDNAFFVEFEPKVFSVTVHNGDASYAGYVTEETLGVYSNASEIEFNVDYGTSVELKIVSSDSSYSIASLILTGVSNGLSHSNESLLTASVSEYGLLLENITSDINLVVRYDAVIYSVSVNQPRDVSQSGTKPVSGGTLALIDFYTGSGEKAPSVAEYMPGSRVFYEIEASENNYITTVTVNGLSYDVFTPSDSGIVFYDWEVSGAYYGVGLKKIGDVFYYYYGKAEYMGDTYLYCTETDTLREVVFLEEDAVNEKYTLVKNEPIVPVGARLTASGVDYDEIVAFLREELKVAEKGIGMTTHEKDLRVTKVKVMVVLKQNLSVNVLTDKIAYRVEAEESEYGTVTLAKRIRKGESVTTESLANPGTVFADADEKIVVKAKPIFGYTVAGYVRNGVTTEVENGGNNTFTMDEFSVDEDVFISFIYRPISYAIGFTASKEGALSVTKRGETSSYVLSRVKTYACDYAESCAFVVTAQAGYVITKIEVGGTEYPVTFNMSEYVFVCQSVAGDVEVVLTCGDYVTEGAQPEANACSVVPEESDRYLSSVLYGASDTTVTLIAETGYAFKAVTIRGQKGGADKTLSAQITGATIVSTDDGLTVVAVMHGDDCRKAISLRMSKDAFDGTAVVSVATEAEIYTVSLGAGCNVHGAVTVDSKVRYGSEATIAINAEAYYYVDYFKINGVLVQFASDRRWDGVPVYEPTVGKYTAGTFLYKVTGDTTIDVAFKKFVYTVELDSDSKNGTTTISVNDAAGGRTVEHGGSFTVGMQANEGYHIKSATVVGESEPFYTPSSLQAANTVRDATFIYQGVDRNLKILVEYEINRYDFTYEIVNASENFAAVGGSGTVSCAYAQTSENTYSGIAHGDNFSLNITPTASLGYYLYSVSVTYKGYSDTAVRTKTRYVTDDDGIILRTGGSVWFNRFWYNPDEVALGVTADIEKITVSFKRETYGIRLVQENEGGKLTAQFVNPTASASGYGVILLGRKKGTDDELTRYYYDIDDDAYYVESSGVRVGSGMRLAYANGTYGEVRFMIGSDEYEMFFEYGLRCTVGVKPDIGYTRTSFTVADENRLDYVVSDAYNFNFYRTTAVSVGYTIQTFNVGINSLIYDNENKKNINAGKSDEYIDVLMTVVYRDGSRETFGSNGTLSLIKVLEYGTKVTFEITSKFASKGVYLYNLTRTVKTSGGGDSVQQIVLPTAETPRTTGELLWGNVEGLIGYGEMVVTGDFLLGAYFQLREYTVSTSITYDEAIVGESANSARRESTNTDRWVVYWGTNTSVRVEIARDVENNIDYGYGYELKKIVLTDAATGQTTELTLTGDETSVTASTDYFTAKYVVDETDEVYGTRNVLHLNGVKHGVSIEVQLTRKTYSAYFVATTTEGLGYIDNIETVFNRFNTAYPTKTIDSSLSSTPWEIQVRHYDELQVTVRPKDGYEITETRVSIVSLTRNRTTGEWEEGTTVTLRYNETGTRDIRYFTFHAASTMAEAHIRGNVRIKLSVGIKRYSLGTTVIRTDSGYDTSLTKNNTVVQLTTYDRQVNGAVLSRPDPLVKGAAISVAEAQHFGIIEYTFTTPEGYRLSSLKANGYTLEDLEANGLLIKKSISKNISDGNRYDYDLVILVNSDLVTGASSLIQLYDISVTLTFSVIEYNVVVQINDLSKNFASYGGRDGVSDGRTITVYTSKTVTHFSTLIVEPVLYEGYEIPAIGALNPSGSTAITLGTDVSDHGLATAFGDVQRDMRSRVSFVITSDSLGKADLSKDFTTIYLHFDTSIIYYDLVMDSMVFYSKNGSLEQTALKNHTAAGTVTYSVKNSVVTGINKEDTFSGQTTYGAIDASMPYFTKVTVEATAASGFAVYDIYELSSASGKAEWVPIENGRNGLTFETRTVGTKTVYTVSFEINSVGNTPFTYNRESRMGRQLRIDFKQKTEVTVIVPNPYRYVASEDNPYRNYFEIMGFESDVQTKTGSSLPASFVTNYAVNDQYKFEVFVGNYFSLLFTDLYRDAETAVSVYSRDLNELATELITNEKCYDTSGAVPVFDADRYETQYTINANFYRKDQVCYGGDANGNRYQIIGKETFYVYDNDAFAHIQATKTTFSAVDSVGGSVFYNRANTESQDNILYQDASGSTKSGKILTITCRAKENYVFYRLKFRKPDIKTSQNAGYIVFDTTSANAWQILTYKQTVDGIPQRSSSVSAFNANNTSDFVLLSYRTEEVETVRGTYLDYVFTLWLNGDIEAEAEFYRTYNVQYGILLTDRYSLGDGILDGIESLDVRDTVFNKPFTTAQIAGDDEVLISYNSEFKLTVPEQTENYVFVGWYVNDVNTFTQLASMTPDADYYTKSFIANIENLKGLSPDGKEEVTDIVIYARFEPVINVQLINEKYYAFSDHFNSWSMGTLQAYYYDYSARNDGGRQGIPATESIATVSDTRGKSISAAKTYLASSPVGQMPIGGNMAWSALYNDAIVAAYSAPMLENVVYTSYGNFTVLHENIVGSDFINNSWTHSTIELHMAGMGSDVEFSSWQYFNWKTKTWEDIDYSYADESYGLSSTGSAYYVTCTSKDYSFSLDYLYQTKQDAINGTVVAMPYALSETSENNVGGTRPLLIRADMYKKVTVSLQQYAFSTSYINGLSDIDRTQLRSSVVSPCISSSYTVVDEQHVDRNFIDSGTTSGEFEYGAKISLLYNADRMGSEVLYNGVRYRFIGWYGEIGDTMYLLGDSDSEAHKVNAFDYRLICAPTLSDTTIYLNAYYVAQYKQVFYSYGISGGSSLTYTACAGKTSGIAAPKMTFSTDETVTDIPILRATMANGMVVYDAATVTYSTKIDHLIVTATQDYSKLSVDGAPYTAQPALAIDLFIDAGLTYTLSVDKTTAVSQTSNIKSNGKANNGFNPEFDTLYQLIEDGTATQDFSPFYNTGKGTYVVADTLRSASYLTGRALHCVPDAERYHAQSVKPSDWATTYRNYYLFTDGEYVPNTQKQWNNASTYYYKDDPKLSGWTNGVKTYVGSSAHKVEIQYVTTAVLVFYNMMYYSGITLTNGTFIRQLTGQNKAAFTVWDDWNPTSGNADVPYSSNPYGDWVESGNGVRGLNQANGEVVIRITLRNMTGNGYACSIKYALNGMHNGNGFPAVNIITDSSGDSLFSPSSSSYSRWVEIDLNGGKYFKNTDSSPIKSTLLFGKGVSESYTRNGSVEQVGVHARTPDQFNLTYCGNGTESNPYNLYYYETNGTTHTTNNGQIQAINTFWQYNEYSCCDWDERLDESTGTYVADKDTLKPNYFKIISQSYSVNVTDLDTNGDKTSSPRGSRTAWTPICGAVNDRFGSGIDEDTPEGKKGFDGVFDGSNVKVIGLALDRQANYSAPYYGFFGKVIGYEGNPIAGTVKNLKFDNVYIETSGYVQYAAALCAYAYKATIENVSFETVFQGNKNANLFTGSTFKNSVAGAQIYLSVSNTENAMVGAIVGYGKNTVIRTVTLKMGANCAVETYSSGYCGGLIGAMEGGQIDSISVNGSSGYIVSDSLVAFTNSSGAAGGLFGYIGGDLTFRGLNVSASQVFIVGSESSNVSGGVFGIVGKGATIQDITVKNTGTSYGFSVDPDSGYTTQGTVVQAAGGSKSNADVAKNVGSYGFAGGLIGVNYGTVSGDSLDGNGLASSYSDGRVTGYIHTYAGIAGGLVGGNFGTIENFTLGSNFRLIAWEPKDRGNSFNYGGIVGYNFSGSVDCRSCVDGEVDSETVGVNGLINDIILTGAGATSDYGENGIMNDTAWNTASVYVFYRNDIDNAVSSTGDFLLKNTPDETSRATSVGSYDDSDNYAVIGGICGYNSGRIYNSGVKSVRISTYRYRYAPGVSSTFGKYGFATYMGLVCGYFDPANETINGWDQYFNDTAVQERGTFDPEDYSNMNNNRIQSCYAYNSSIVLSYALWMDNKWNAKTTEDYSCAVGMSLGGIAGGSSVRAKSEFAINNCYSKGNSFYAAANAYGATNTESSQTATSQNAGWAFWEVLKEQGLFGSEKKTFYFCKCIRPWCNVELNFANICSGLSVDATGKQEGNKCNYSFSYGNEIKGFTSQATMSDTVQDLGSSKKTLWVFGGDGGAGDMGNPWRRYIHYAGETKGSFPENYYSSRSLDYLEDCFNGINYQPAERGLTGYMYGFYINSLVSTPSEYGTIYSSTGVDIIKTDPTTGCLYICSDGNYTAYKDGEEWKYVLRGSVNPSRANRTVRGIGYND